MNSEQLRQTFLTFFKEKGHTVIPSASLVPENDPTVLFTTAGMQPLVPFFLGEKHPEGARLANFQKCIRTVDIDEVGDATHLTFFEMMGYWSLGDYWKREALNYTYELVTKELGISQDKLAVTVFAGEDGIPRDDEAADVWRSLGFSEDRIAYLGREDNFWGPAGTEGPCGPDSEIYAWIGEGEVPKKFDVNNKGWMEIGNDVFMQYYKGADGNYAPLNQKNVDFGAGFERIAAYLEGKKNVFETELFVPLIKKLEALSGKKYEEYQKEFRIVVDHIKAAVFAIGDGAVPSNKDRGYIVRRLIRRAIVKAHQIGIEKNFTTEITKEVFDIYRGVYFNGHSEGALMTEESSHGENTAGSFASVQDGTKEKRILDELEKEETKFRRTLREGLKLIDLYQEIDGKILFDLYQSYGLPLEISVEEAQRRGITVSETMIEQFNDLKRGHQELSRTASAGMFKGGLADAGDMAVKYHTATHLLLAALRKVLGDHVLQRGSNITAERLRFDFSHPEKMTPEQIKEAEDLVNEQIEKDLPVAMEEMTVDEAKAAGAMGVFESKYGEKVKVYTIGESRDSYFSKEICGGPHVTHTGELGHFKIAKEEASSAGVRRIKAVLE